MNDHLHPLFKDILNAAVPSQPRPAEEPATCRGCGMVLRGKAYHLGGRAFHPRTGEECPVNHYGGFVCSEQCDHNASVRQHASMPGCAGATRPDTYAAERIRRNWSNR